MKANVPLIFKSWVHKREIVFILNSFRKGLVQKEIRPSLENQKYRRYIIKYIILNNERWQSFSPVGEVKSVRSKGKLEGIQCELGCCLVPQEWTQALA